MACWWARSVALTRLPLAGSLRHAKAAVPLVQRAADRPSVGLPGLVEDARPVDQVAWTGERYSWTYPGCASQRKYQRSLAPLSIDGVLRAYAS
jgi:hypothetical protein